MYLFYPVNLLYNDIDGLTLIILIGGRISITESTYF